MKDMDILDDMGVSTLSAKGFFFFFKVNYSFKKQVQFLLIPTIINVEKNDNGCDEG